MKHLVLLLCMLIHAIPLLSAEYWEQKQSTPFLRTNYQGFSASGKMYIVGGVSIDMSQFSREVWEYDPVIDRWTQRADFPGNKCIYGVGFELNGRGYITTGSQLVGDFRDPEAAAADSNALWEYNPAIDTWMRKADFPGKARTMAFGFSLNGKAYVGGGRATNQLPSYNIVDFWEYDPAANTWTRKADITAAGGMPQSTAFADDQFGYAGLGDINNSRNFLRYDPVSDVWTSIAPFPDSSVHEASGCFVHGKRYVIGGTFTYADFFGGYRKAFVYDPVENRWDSAAAVLVDYPIVGIAANLQGELYYYGGHRSPSGDVASVYHLKVVATDVVETAQSGDMIKVFPTPFHHTLYLESTGEIVEVMMYNVVGEQVHSVQMYGRTCQLTSEQLVPGVYFIKVRTADNKEVTIKTLRGQ